MKIIRTKSELRALTTVWRKQAETIGVVPTMGALHAGHLSLVEAAKAGTDRVIVTLFVNPRQFNSAEDLVKYPRTEEADVEKLAPFDIDVLYVPDPDQIYPDGFETTVSVSGISDVLCGASRPGHFDGVATVVTKLLVQTDADKAYFGEKDFQQVQVVRRFVQDLDLGTEIVPCPTVREADGLALSSRNLRLGKQGRKTAPVLHRIMENVVQAVQRGEADPINMAKAELEEAGFGPIDYLEIRHDDDLSLATLPGRPARLYAAVWLDGVRLIDNLAVSLPA